MQKNATYFDDEINFRELFNVLWAAKKLIILITAIFAIGSVAYAVSLNNYYTSWSLLSVRSDSGDQGSSIGGLAAMVGLSLPSSGEDRAAQTIELIKSRQFVKHLMTFDDILPSIMAAKTYNSASQELLFNQKLYDSETKTWKQNPSNSGSKTPSYLQAHLLYNDMMSISQDRFTGFISITVEHISPLFAKEFLDLIIKESNELVRKKDMEESKQRLMYLTSELSKTTFVEIKDSINTLIEAQLEKQMLAQIHQDYVLIEIEPPYIPEKKSRPSRANICVLGTLLGGMLSLLIVLIRHYFFTEEQKTVE